jgi:hypothetical protein
LSELVDGTVAEGHFALSSAMVLGEGNTNNKDSDDESEDQSDSKSVDEQKSRDEKQDSNEKKDENNENTAVSHSLLENFYSHFCL